MSKRKSAKNKKGSVIVSLLLTNVVALILINLWFGYYDFGPSFVGTVSFQHALEDFLRAEVVLGGGFLVLFNGYVIIWNLFLKNQEKSSKSKRATQQANRKK
ncbi:hypothetical protein ACPD8N_06620 [Lacticaseibacillus chiayiensis]|uniref:hypothetical protein n=1 Tax=Lacticaseibacillus chiayiensis TaxID=2100821 RepID=UPI003C75EB2A